LKPTITTVGMLSILGAVSYASTAVPKDEDVKLLCDVEIVERFDTGEKHHSWEQVPVDVGQHAGTLTIAINGLHLKFGMTTGIADVHDESVEGRWQLYQDKAEYHIKRRVTIDRNSGHFSFTSYKSDVKQQIDAEGMCSSVDMTKRKF